MRPEDFCKKRVSIESIIQEVVKDKDLLLETVKGISSDRADMKFKCGKVIRTLSEEKPVIVYPYWDFFKELLASDNTFIKSIGMAIIANLTKVDTKNKFVDIFNEYYDLLNDKSMITAANLAGYSGMIAKAKPDLQNNITTKLLEIDKTHHSTECKNIIKGKAILSFNEYFDQSENKQMILEFVKCELKNGRAATKKKAEKFLKKWDKKF